MFLLFLYWCTWPDVIFKKSIVVVIQYIDPYLPISAGGHQIKKPAFIHLELLDRIVPKLNISLRYDTVVFMCNRVRYRP